MFLFGGMAALGGAAWGFRASPPSICVTSCICQGLLAAYLLLAVARFQVWPVPFAFGAVVVYMVNLVAITGARRRGRGFPKTFLKWSFVLIVLLMAVSLAYMMARNRVYLLPAATFLGPCCAQAALLWWSHPEDAGPPFQRVPDEVVDAEAIDED